VRRSVGKYPVPPVRPGGKWRPPGADRPPAPPKSRLQDAVAACERAALHGTWAINEIERLSEASASGFENELSELHWIVSTFVDEFAAWQQSPAIVKKLHAHDTEHHRAWHVEQREISEARAAQRKLERAEKARKERARKAREKKKAAKAATSRPKKEPPPCMNND
jgi:hypothetical protein